MLAVPVAETVLEQRAGGDLYDRGVDGTICRWVRVLVFDPAAHHRLQLGHRARLADHLRPGPCERGRITFAGEDDGRTRVTLVHRHLERHGEGWESLRAGLDAAGGWPLYLRRYEDLAQGRVEVP